MDPATIVPQVFKQSLVSGSKDNMSGILIYFGGQNFDANAELKKYIPGPLNPEDSRFVEKYKNDALKHGVHNWQELAAVISFLVFEDYLYIVFRRFQSTPQTISSHKALCLPMRLEPSRSPLLARPHRCCVAEKTHVLLRVTTLSDCALLTV